MSSTPHPVTSRRPSHQDVVWIAGTPDGAHLRNHRRDDEGLVVSWHEAGTGFPHIEGPQRPPDLVEPLDQVTDGLLAAAAGRAIADTGVPDAGAMMIVARRRGGSSSSSRPQSRGPGGAAGTGLVS